MSTSLVCCFSDQHMIPLHYLSGNADTVTKKKKKKLSTVPAAEFH